MSVSKPPQFEPAAQIEQTCEEFVTSLGAARSAVDRVLFLKDKLLADFKALRVQADALEVFTEEEAAILLKLDEKPATAARHLASLRKQFDLPHFKAGNKPRYTKQHLIEICDILAVNPKRRQTSAERPRLQHAA